MNDGRSGSAIGAELELALAHHIRRRLGVILGVGELLPRAVSLSKAREMIFTGHAIDAKTAEGYGLVSQTLRMAKSLIREGQRVGLDTLLELSAALQPIAQHTSDHREAVSALWEKREAS